MTFRLTKTGRLILGVAALFYLAALTSQSSLLLFPVGMLLTCLGLNAAYCWRSLKGIELRPPKSDYVLEGQSTNQSWQLVNHGRCRAGFLEAESRLGCLFRLPTLESLQEISLRPDPVFRKRGVFLHSDLQLSSIYPLGLVQVTVRHDVPGEVVVGPAIYAAEAPRVAGFEAIVGGKQKGKYRSLSGADFAGVRPMQSGDAVKHVHWRSSAKGLGWMVKTFDQELAGRAAFVLDGGHGGDAEALDNCLRAAGSLMVAALDAGHHVQWVDLARLESRLILPLADIHTLLEDLARLSPSPGSLNPARLDLALGSLSSRNAVHFVLTECPDFVAQTAMELHRARRQVTLYLPQGTPSPGVSGVPVHFYAADQVLEGA